MNTTSILGAVALVIIFLSALFGIYSPRVRDGVLGRLLYMAIAVVCLGGIIHIVQDTVPKHVLTTLLLCVAGLMVRDVFRVQYWKGIKARGIIAIKCAKAKAKTR